MLLGATGTGKSATTAWLIERVQRPTLVMAPNKTLAAQLANELREMLPGNAVEYFVSYYDYYQPEAYIAQTDTYIEKDSSINDDVERLRHSATSNLLSRRDVVVVASVSCIYGLGTPQSYLDRSVELSVGQDVDRDALLRLLVDVQYRATTCRSRVAASGSAATPSRSSRVRGTRGAASSSSVTKSRRSTTCIRSREMSPGGGFAADLPATHYVAGPERMEKAMAGIEEELEQRPPIWRPRVNCLRHNGFGCAPATTWK